VTTAVTVPGSVEPWDEAEALRLMAAVQRVVAQRDLDPCHDELKRDGAPVVAFLKARNLTGLREACRRMTETAYRLPRGKFDWNPTPRPDTPGRCDGMRIRVTQSGA
jgi:hypothetical protein